MATVTNSIGTASRDYSTIALWEAALPASAVTAGNSYVGQCYNDSVFDQGTTQLLISGTTTDATHTITLTTGPGQSFRDNAGAATNALRYNASNGVSITGAVDYNFVVSVQDANVTLSNLQIRNTSATGNAGAVVSGFLAASANLLIDSCIFESRGSTSAHMTLELQGNATIVQNSLVVNNTSAASSIGIFLVENGTVINCTVVKPTNVTSGASSVGIQGQYNDIVVQNCAIAGFHTAIAKGGTHSVTGSGNATDVASYPSGVTGQTSLTIATEFVQPDNTSSVMDWRLKSTSVACKDNGTNSGAPSTDIIGQAISNVIRDAGAWELQQGGGGAAFIAQKPYTILQGVNRAATY